MTIVDVSYFIVFLNIVMMAGGRRNM